MFESKDSNENKLNFKTLKTSEQESCKTMLMQFVKCERVSCGDRAVAQYDVLIETFCDVRVLF